MRRFLLITVVVLIAFAFVGNAGAQMPQLIRLKVGSTDTLNLGAKPKEVSVENTEIATVEVQEDGAVLVTGVAEGNTTLIGVAADGKELILPIIVEAKKKAPADEDDEPPEE